MLGFAFFLAGCSALLSARLTSCSARLLVCSSDPLFSSFSLLSFFLLFIHSLICSALPALCSARWGGVLTLLQKKARFHSSIRKFPPFFQKKHHSILLLTPHILRTVLHLAPPSPHLNKIGKKSPRSLASVDELPLIFLEFSFAVSKIMIIFVV